MANFNPYIPVVNKRSKERLTHHALIVGKQIPNEKHSDKSKQSEALTNVREPKK